MSAVHTSATRCRKPIRFWWLHARARGIPWAAAALVLVALAAWAAAHALAHPDFTVVLADGTSQPSGAGPASGDHFEPDRRVPVVAGASLLAILLCSGGLAGADPDLEQSTPTRWPRWRAAHLLGILLAVGGLLAIAVIPAATTFGAAAMTRNVIGYLGLTAVSATLLGASLAWAPPLVYAAAVYLAAPRQATGAALWWAWPMQPGGWDASWICTALICLAGVAAFVRYGSGAMAGRDAT